MNSVRSHIHWPSPAMAVAVLALFVALGGSSYAAITITGNNVENGTLTSADLKNNSVTSVDIRSGSLVPQDFKAGQLPAGPQGVQGPQGIQGPKGDQGPPGISGLQRVSATSGPNSDSPKEVMANCPEGKSVIGTGYDISGAVAGTPPNMDTDVALDQLQPSDETTVPGWVAAAASEVDPSTREWSLGVFALCAYVR